MKYNNRPEITENRVLEIKNVIFEHPEWNRTMISKHICRIWGWQYPNGQLKEISCRDVLRELDKCGRICLPPSKRPLCTSRKSDKIKYLNHEQSPVKMNLSELRPLHISTVNSKDELVQFKSFLAQYHYLGFDRSVGENIKYMVYSRDGIPLSCLMFGSASWSCRDRDKFIGWNKVQRQQYLNLTTNNTRFLIFPWVTVPHLASHILSLVTGRISNDWQLKYGHPVYCLETFVEVGRFRGVCYKAANWINVGSTTGRGRNGGHHNAILPIKDIYIYPLVSKFRELLNPIESEG